jgi:hypothetical protein
MSVEMSRKCARAWDVLVAVAGRHGKITYGDLANEIGGIARGLGPTLQAIEMRCRLLGVPALSALVVRLSDGQPSNGYGGPSNLVETYRAIYGHPWRSTGNPFS